MSVAKGPLIAIPTAPNEYFYITFTWIFNIPVNHRDTRYYFSRQRLFQNGDPEFETIL